MARVAMENWEERIRDPKIECMSRDEMSALQSERLVKQVKNVYDNVAFYREKMDALGLEPGDIRGIEDITKLPFTTKEDLRNNYPFGLLAVPQSKIARVQGTSGTTGKLTLASYTQKDVDVWGECVARALTMAGLTEEDKLHVCYGYGLFTGGMGLDLGARALGCMAIPMSSGNTQRQLMCMEDFGATAFACTPSYALYLAEAAQEAGIVDRLQLKAGINGAEPWTDEMRLKIESILNVNCFDIYGLCEVTGPGVAMDCIHHKGLHVYEDYFYPEVLNPADHSPCADGETGELVFTTLAKEGMPLLRYRTKDLTSIDHSPCACGRTLPRIQKFTGRTDDMKVIRGVNVFPTQVEAVLLKMGGGVAPHYMMIVDRVNNLDVLTVMVEVDERFFSDQIRELDALRERIADALKQALGVSVVVKLVEPKTIQRSEGKAKRVIDNRNLV
ncbi:MAG: phenylacetate--CoA ligase [bacterium]|nr:phenylacetate--CoA ligase [bacterium]